MPLNAHEIQGGGSHEVALSTLIFLNAIYHIRIHVVSCGGNQEISIDISILSEINVIIALLVEAVA